MANDLDQMLARLARDTATASLEGVEDAVLRGIAQRRDALRAARALAPVRAASVSLALALGVAAGGMAAAMTMTEPRHLDTFSSAARLAPSTLLEAAR